MSPAPKAILLALMHSGPRSLVEFLLGRWRELSRGGESVVVDLVVEHAKQVRPQKPAHGMVRVDPAEEICA